MRTSFWRPTAAASERGFLPAPQSLSSEARHADGLVRDLPRRAWEGPFRMAAFGIWPGKWNGIRKFRTRAPENGTAPERRRGRPLLHPSNPSNGARAQPAPNLIGLSEFLPCHRATRILLGVFLSSLRSASAVCTGRGATLEHRSVHEGFWTGSKAEVLVSLDSFSRVSAKLRRI